MTRSPIRSLLVALCSLVGAVLLASAFTSCRRADAMPRDGAPGLVVERFAADSSRVIARWAKACDAKGCPDSYSVRWTAGALTVSKSTTALADTLRLALPAVGDSVLVTLTVTPVRRGLSGAARTASRWIVNTDAPPPAVDSLRVDTLARAAAMAAALAAEMDSFPVRVLRLSSGRAAIGVDSTAWVCTLARNRYTGAVWTMIAADMSESESTAYATACDAARSAYALEQSG